RSKRDWSSDVCSSDLAAIRHTEDLELVKIFTRRDPQQFSNDKMEHTENILEYQQEIDVLLLALGSATDIPTFGPDLAKHFNTVRSEERRVGKECESL